MCKRICGNCVKEEFEGREVGGRIFGTGSGRDILEKTNRMKLGKSPLDLVGRKPVGSWERENLSRTGQVETRCGDLGVN